MERRSGTPNHHGSFRLPRFRPAWADKGGPSTGHQSARRLLVAKWGGRGPPTMATFRSRSGGLAPTGKPTLRRRGLMFGPAPSDKSRMPRQATPSWPSPKQHARPVGRCCPGSIRKAGFPTRPIPAIATRADVTSPRPARQPRAPPRHETAGRPRRRPGRTVGPSGAWWNDNQDDMAAFPAELRLSGPGCAGSGAYTPAHGGCFRALACPGQGRGDRVRPGPVL
jgi:hypothetical protein